MIFWHAASDSGSAFTGALKLSVLFWQQTLTAMAQHAGIILLYAAPPATVRAWILLRTKPVPAWWLPSLEAFVALWRLLMCGVAVWVVLTPAQMNALRGTVTSDASIQVRLSRLGEIIGRQVWLLAWEIVLFAAAFLLLCLFVNLVARFWIQGQDADPIRLRTQRAAFATVGRNLLVYPLALIYIVVVVRRAVG
jgi:hypothetical protein